MIKRFGLVLLTCFMVGATSCNLLGGDEEIEFFEPYAQFGTLRSATENYMEGYSIYESSDDSILYNGKDMVYRYLYHFTDGKLAYSVLSVEKQYGQALVDFIESKYDYVGYTIEGASVYANADRSLAITIYDGENLVLATYSPYPDNDVEEAEPPYIE